MSVETSNRLSGMVQSDIRAMTRECIKHGGINLGQGLCDLPTPKLVEDGAIRAIRERKSLYSTPEGIPELRQAIAEKLKKQNGLEVHPDENVVVTVGSAGGFVSTLMALLNPGDGILLFEPYYGYHLNTAILAGLEPHYCTLDANREFALSKEALLKSIRPNTKAVVVCTPANPSGKMWNAEELNLLAEVAEEKDLLVITDEIYEYYRYEGRPHVSPASVGNLWKRSVTLMGLSKTFSITGWRLGYAVAPKDLAKSLILVNDLFYICAPTPLQHGVAEGFKTPESEFEEMREEFLVKRERICSALNKAGMTPVVPQGAYYVLADVSKFKYPDSKAAAMALLEQVKVAAIPGRAFYSAQSPDKDKFLRFCYAIDDDQLIEACKRIEKFRPH